MMPQSYQDFFGILAARQILFCSWKNNHELDLVFTAGSDLDLLVQENDEVEVRECLETLGWFRLINPASRFSKILHYYKFDGERFLHIHLYLRLWTGHSWAKEYEIPLVEDVLNSTVTDGKYGIPIPSRSHALALHRFRSRVKRSSISGRFLYWRDQISYACEYSFILTCKESDNVRGGVVFPEMEATLCSHPWRRFSKARVISQILAQFSARALFKLLRIKKIISGNGRIVVISGPDGAGKSTLVSALISLHKTIQVTGGASLGRPYGRLINTLIGMRVKKNPEEHDRALKGKPFSVYKGSKAIVVATFRCFAGVRCRILRYFGVLVLSDRWPSSDVGGIDGPKIPRVETGILKFMGRVESALYRTIPAADLAIILKVDLDKALSRNLQRHKPGKETDEELRGRYKSSQSLAPKASRTIVFENNGTLHEALLGIECLISRGISWRANG